jgi:hypothetical protein
MRQRLVIGQIIDRHHLNIRTRGNDSPVEVTADPTKSIDAYPNSHCWSPW